jgi:diguanylate cyclase
VPHATEPGLRVEGLSSVRRAPGQIALGIGIATWLGFAISTVARPTPGWHEVFDAWMYSVPGIAAAGITTRCALLHPNRRERWTWLSATIALACYSVGNLVNGLMFAKLDDPPLPSPADLAWILFYPFISATVIGLLRSRTDRLQKRMWLDGLMAGAGFAAIIAAAVFSTISEAAKGSPLAVATNLTYPVADLLLLVLIGCAFAVESWRPTKSLLLLGAGVVCYALADTLQLRRR